MGSKKGIGLTVGILIAIAGASFIFWAIPEQSSMTIIVTDFENHLDGIKAKHNVISSGLEEPFSQMFNGELSPQEHEKIELERGGQNYSPLKNVVVSHVKDSSTLICRKPSKDSVSAFIEEELIDGLCCYSSVNQVQLNQEIVDAVVHHLHHEKLNSEEDQALKLMKVPLDYLDPSEIFFQTHPEPDGQTMPAYGNFWSNNQSDL